MTTLTDRVFDWTRTQGDPAVAIRNPLAWHWPLTALAVAMVASALFSVGGMILDDRTLLGAPLWAKPFKFSVSFLLYAPVLAWMISLLSRGRRVGWWVGTVIALASAIEMAVILGQAARGTSSHFNNSTPQSVALYSLMGATIAVLWLANLIIASLLLATPIPDSATRWAVRLGLVIAMIGMSVGFLMVSATPEPIPGLDMSTRTPAGAHSVGVADGGPGLPLVGWSTTGGDLRIGHFIGMHGLQALPLLAAGLALLGAGRLTETVRTRLVLLAGAAYAGLVVLVTWQALRGEPLLGPSLPVLGAAAARASGTAAAAALVVRSGQSPAADRALDTVAR